MITLFCSLIQQGTLWSAAAVPMSPRGTRVMNAQAIAAEASASPPPAMYEKREGRREHKAREGREQGEGRESTERESRESRNRAPREPREPRESRKSRGSREKRGRRSIHLRHLGRRRRQYRSSTSRRANCPLPRPPARSLLELNE